jgi:hypothetical protein
MIHAGSGSRSLGSLDDLRWAETLESRFLLFTLFINRKTDTDIWDASRRKVLRINPILPQCKIGIRRRP